MGVCEKTQSRWQPRKHKARLVAAGCGQIKGIDFETGYSPVVRGSSVRLLLTVAAAKGYVLRFFDTVGAYLYAPMTRAVYVAQPPGFEKLDDAGKPFVCLLNKSLYGLPESGRNWFNTVCSILKKAGLQQSQYDPCIFFSISDNHYFLCSIWVDDKAFVADSNKTIEKFVKKINQEIEMIEVKSQNYLGMEISRSHSGITLSNKEYIEKKLSDYRLDKINPVRSVCSELKPLGENPQSKLVCQSLYREMLGCLMFISNTSRPDIQYQVQALSKFSNSPREAHLNAMKRVFAYLKSTVNQALHFPPGEMGSLSVCADASWSSMEDSKSVSGVCIRIGKVPLVWKTKKQDMVAHSSCESEVEAMCLGVKLMKPITGLLSEICPGSLEYPIVLETDSRSGMELIINGGSSNSTHYLRRINILRNEVDNGNVRMKFIPSSQCSADILTKPCTGIKTGEIAKKEFLLY